jgi:hypothetical protein
VEAYARRLARGLGVTEPDEAYRRANGLVYAANRLSRATGVVPDVAEAVHVLLGRYYGQNEMLPPEEMVYPVRSGEWVELPWRGAPVEVTDGGHDVQSAVRPPQIFCSGAEGGNVWYLKDAAARGEQAQVVKGAVMTRILGRVFRLVPMEGEPGKDGRIHIESRPDNPRGDVVDFKTIRYRTRAEVRDLRIRKLREGQDGAGRGGGGTVSY